MTFCAFAVCLRDISVNCFSELLLLFTNHIPSCDLIDVTRIERLKPHIAYASRIPKLGAKREKVPEVQTALGGLEEDDNEEDEGEYQDESDIYLRSKFFESWLWKSIDLPAQADRDG